MSIHSIPLQKILFLDIETVPLYEHYSDLKKEMQELWDTKSKRFQEAGNTGEDVYEKAGIFAEFGKIICISVAHIHKANNKLYIRATSFVHDDEKELLSTFNFLIKNHFNTKSHFLCAHNGKEFDFPFIARRSLIHGIDIPKCLDTRGMKPWDIRHLDTMDMWRFGDYKNYTSLKLLANIFNIPSPKQDIDGSMIYDVYYKENNIKRIKDYCELDAIAVAQLYLKFLGKVIVPEENITILNDSERLATV